MVSQTKKQRKHYHTKGVNIPVTKKTKKNTEEKPSYQRRYFLPHARLNRGQRKYCHCLMKARLSTKNPYAACQVMRQRVAQSAKTTKDKRQLTFKPSATNCIMSYDYSDYTLEEVQKLAKEKGIPVTYNTAVTNKKSTTTQKAKYKPYSKDKLVEKITQKYISSRKDVKKKREQWAKKHAK